MPSLQSTHVDPGTVPDCPHRNHFRTHIRRYNSALSFTSTGTTVDESYATQPGPYIYRIGGDFFHRLGSLLPPGDLQIDLNDPAQREQLKGLFAQVWIYDPSVQTSRRMDITNGDLKEEIDGGQ
ncbi:hypothetical protein EDD21DRAFT_35327 [Dissophora ornata]|nr:hypothetical protein EDD21DRAFT_35327 [Dissophora ornata]